MHLVVGASVLLRIQYPLSPSPSVVGLVLLLLQSAISTVQIIRSVIPSSFRFQLLLGRYSIILLKGGLYLHRKRRLTATIIVVAKY